MALSHNQMITFGIASLSLVISVVGTCLQHSDLSKDRTARCNDEVAQFQSDLSVTTDSLLKSAGDFKLGVKTLEAGQLDDVLINFRRSLRLFEKKQRSHSCSSNKTSQFTILTREIDSVRDSVSTESDFKLNKLIELGKTLAQDDALPSDCCE